MNIFTQSDNLTINNLYYLSTVCVVEMSLCDCCRFFFFNDFFLLVGNPSKKKCGKFHTWSGESGPGHFPYI